MSSGEQRQVLADLLWARAQKIIDDLKEHGGTAKMANNGLEATTMNEEPMNVDSINQKPSSNSVLISEDHIASLNRYF